MKANDTWTLGDDVIPERYALTMDVNFKKFVFGGDETIDVLVRKPVDEIRLNSKDLKIEAVSIVCKGTTYPARISTDKVRDELIMRVPVKISGSAKVHVKFSGKNNDNMFGFYRSSYESKGKTRYLLSTQMEAVSARSAFPCFDEPEKKAKFALRLIVDNGLDTISNMPIKKTTRQGKGKKLVEFYETPRMSSYLLYIGVGNFEFVNKKTRRVLLRVATVPGRAKLAPLSLGFAEKFLKFFESYFGINYPLPKLDMIAVPDFAAGAMENWGAMAFREATLLGDAKKSAKQYSQYVATVVAHEMAHQWFGDLVTMKWWDDLWLNESFASMMECKAPDTLFPEWSMYDRQLIGRMSDAMGTDQLKNTRTVNAHVRNPAEIEQMFDPGISYSKGSAILFMLEDYVGKEAFRKGLHNYLKSKRYSNASKEDLWDAIGSAAGSKGARETESMVRAWIDRPGFPIVKVEKKGSGLHIRQDRFTLSETMKGSQPWPIPLHYKVQGKPDSRMLMLKKTASMKVPVGKWIKLNYSQAGFYRVEYPDELLDLLGEAMRAGDIKGRDAWGIMSDFFVLVRSGRKSASRYLDFVDKYCFVYDPILNLSVLGQLQWLHDMASGTLKTRTGKITEAYGRMLLGKLSWTQRRGEHVLETLLRSASISALGMLQCKDVADRCVSMFHAYAKSGKEIDVDLRTTVFRIAAYNDPSTYAVLKRLYGKTQVPEETRRLIVALGSTGMKNLKPALAFSLSRSVKLQDSFVIPAVESDLPGTYKTLWTWTKRNWKGIMGRYPIGTLMLDRFVENFSTVNDRATYADFKKFFGKKENMRGDIKRQVAQTRERIEANLAFMKKNNLG